MKEEDLLELFKIVSMQLFNSMETQEKLKSIKAESELLNRSYSEISKHTSNLLKLKDEISDKMKK